MQKPYQSGKEQVVVIQLLSYRAGFIREFSSVSPKNLPARKQPSSHVRVRPERKCPPSFETKPKKLPEDFEFFIHAEFLVASDHRDLFAHGLGNDLPL